MPSLRTCAPSTVQVKVPLGHSLRLRSSTWVPGCAATTARSSRFHTVTRTGLSSGYGLPSGLLTVPVVRLGGHDDARAGRAQQGNRSTEQGGQVTVVGRVADVLPPALVVAARRL